MEHYAFPITCLQIVQMPHCVNPILAITSILGENALKVIHFYSKNVMYNKYYSMQ